MIRRAEKEDLPEILRVYRAAKAYMVKSGNPTQWEEGYPDCVLDRDLERGQLYVFCGGTGAIHAAFVFALGEDPTYALIEGGSWASSEPYGAIHRLGSDGAEKGVFSRCLEFCKGLSPYIRADTHADNRTMQHLLKKHGFLYRGVIYTGDGSPRLAYDYLSRA